MRSALQDVAQIGGMAPATDATEPFSVSVPQAALDDLNRRPAETRWPYTQTVNDQVWYLHAQVDQIPAARDNRITRLKRQDCSIEQCGCKFHFALYLALTYFLT
jgi:hypothetical protein